MRVYSKISFVLCMILLAGCALPGTGARPTQGALIPPRPTDPPPMEEPGEPPVTNSPIAFETLAQGDVYTAELETPRIFVFQAAGEVSAISSWFASPLQSALAGVDYTQYAVVVVFYGMASSSGYGIAVQQVQQQLDTVKVLAQFSQPDPNMMQSDVISYPYHAILVPKSALTAPVSMWALCDPAGVMINSYTP